ncbi:ABC transporter permease [Butyrivibrio sp. INlla16]|uniref:ABC transporter permease n=1 Tax=Butyrivibrio sp. INlla16 TaxID=1520807 RepID=UPI000887FAA7|nr:FtsX-like permease family protein [Butyrivibrio sp. INlla16]SDB34170.1 putative ABC transport system permease protein [Butyrivibrio sp. INlla16]
MYKRLLLNDLKKNKLSAMATCIFMAVNATLLGLSILLFASLSGAIDSLMRVAITPDFLQMHTGEINDEELRAFSHNRSDVSKWQVCEFLNLPNSMLRIGDKTFDTNMQDNGLCYQSEEFDYLVDMDNNIIDPGEGEVYVPVCYRDEYEVKVGDVLSIGSEELTVAGFLRDSQMNSVMASSKRFLVSKADYERLRLMGSEEYLIEYKLILGNDINAFATAYKDANLPDNGPTISYPLIRMMNALSDGLMILIILLVSVVVLFISMLCIRCMLLTQLERDKTEIGMLKAIGVSRRGIRTLYMRKYMILSVFGCIFGSILAVVISEPLSVQMKALYGDAGGVGKIGILMIIGEIFLQAIILLYVRLTLSKTEKASAVLVMNGQGSFVKKKNLWIPIGIITTFSVFMILIPLNIKSTLCAPDFVTYMGIGKSQIRIDIRQTDGGDSPKEQLQRKIGTDARVSDFVLMQTKSYKTEMPDGASYNLLIENGDHGRFPVSYSKGTFPSKEGEIALSVLNAEEMKVDVGDTVKVFTDKDGKTDSEISCKVCGIYSDVTNGGKTAKACMLSDNDNLPVMWSIIYVSLKDGQSLKEWTEGYRNAFANSGEGIKVTLISEYLDGVYGQTIENIKRTSVVVMIFASFVLFVVILLMLRLLIWRERDSNSFKKALGFTSGDIRKEYLKQAAAVLVIGIVLGIIAGVFPGEGMAGAVLGMMGAKGFRFIMDPFYVGAVVPLLIVITVLAAAFTALLEIKNIRAKECLGAGQGR